MWNERGFDAIRPADGEFCQSSGHEGDFVSVRRPFAWKKGKYTYRLTRMDRETVGDKPYTWVGAFVRVHATDENIFVGALRFKGENLMLDGKVAPASAEAVYPKGVPDYADTAVKDGSLVITVGAPVAGRDKRRVKLIDATK
ncbi:hypothetical protein GobsT_57660 [Gemmata obscuriglobus]|uniref:Uncharacterized protein n=1 Tax=Gemmata obscuriglobus TaxID=114 RepID=A0A2Z3GV55_9BACT|nr:hypothetical protein [Gemmata obscuriglobus]AWM36431.1 hypothetical protein C1280_04950 [Gemmata obscuriglobus]QEG30948.1 hypothetical protein GobsT_57660 [Gemmata obscuriglobus]VTS10281.1 Uncharacterized protein OS=Pedosphaera parvula (strain Ellin514) GN=Cflav_PD0515 PE=4 SV=1: DUF3472 [Gemmata obscuriglobus UQM 2246]